MKKPCSNCGVEFNVKPSRFEAAKYCSIKCASKKVTQPCAECGKLVTRCKSQMLKTVYCGRICSKIGTGRKFTELNRKLNPERMTVQTRTKLRAKGLLRGEKKTYEKTFGVHTHRIVAAQKLGRPLKKGEVVHHKDEVKRNNSPENLEIFKSQAEHARHHKLNGKT